MFPLNEKFLQNIAGNIKDKYKILTKLGSGLTSTVKKIKERDSGKMFAVKIFKKSQMNEQQISNTQREASVLAELNHPNVLQLHDFYMCDQYICIVTECMQMSLMDYLNEHYDSLSRDYKLQIFRQVAEAVDYCHGQGIMHRDIKLENILVNADASGQISSLKLADFGFACTAEELNSDDNFCGSLQYMAPEQLQSESVYDQSADIWSLGHILFQLLTGGQLYDEAVEDDSELAGIILKKPLNFREYGLERDDRKLLRMMLCFNRENRETSSKIVRNPLLQVAEDSKSESISQQSLM